MGWLLQGSSQGRQHLLGFDHMTLATSSNTLAEFLVKRGIPLPPLGLIDVGVSGGINPAWRLWGEKLSALGIDAIENEISRLTAAEKCRGIRYVAARVGGPAGSSAVSLPTRSNYALHRSAAYLATAALATGTSDFAALWRDTVGMETPPAEAGYTNVADPMRDPFYAYYARRFTQAQTPRMTDRASTVDMIVAEAVTLQRVDVLKVDTDGADFDALRGAEGVIKDCLAVEVEVQFHGPVSPTANVFCNIDAMMRDSGFSLFKLAPALYARSALPRPFVYDIPAQNTSGQIAWADALYVRDLDTQADPDRRRNLALILDIYGLEDATAEVLLATPSLFGDNSLLLDFLTGKVYGAGVTYRQLTKAFMADPIGFTALLEKNSVRA
jgi:FkbM family methyltransferase